MNCFDGICYISIGIGVTIVRLEPLAYALVEMLSFLLQ